MIDEVQEAVVSPVDVLHGKDQGLAGSHAFKKPPPGVEEVLPAEMVLATGTDQDLDVGSERRVPEQLLYGTGNLQSDSLRRVVFEDLALDFHRLGEGRLRHVAVGQVAALAPDDRLGKPLPGSKKPPRQPL